MADPENYHQQNPTSDLVLLNELLSKGILPKEIAFVGALMVAQALVESAPED